MVVRPVMLPISGEASGALVVLRDSMSHVGGFRGSRSGVSAASQRAGQHRDADCGWPAAWCASWRRAAAALYANEPREPGEAEDAGDEEVEPHPEDVAGGVDAQGFLEDAEARVAGDVEGEKPPARGCCRIGRATQETGEREVPDHLVEEGRLEGRVLLVAPGGCGSISRPQGRLVGPPKSSWLK